jgi:two-component system, OmpR family, sensor histidine kinase CiaH
MTFKHPYILDIKNKLAVRFGLTFILVIVFSASSVRFFMDRMETYNKILIMQDTRGEADMFSQNQLDYLSQQMSVIKDRLYKELIIANLAVVAVFVALSYLLSERLFEPLEASLERERNFVADASHELRTPLAAVNSICEVTLRSPNNTADDYKTALNQVFEESQRLSTTINDLLFLSKGDSQNIKLKMARVDLTKIMEKVNNAMQFVADKNSIKIEEISPDKAVLVNVDEDKIKQLLTILIDNAIRYSERGSKVIMKLEDKPRIKLSVQDFGQGIDPQDLPHIFERFYRSDKSRSDSGSGLGLSIAKWIVEAHNIRMDVKSEPEKGSTFSLIFNAS